MKNIELITKIKKRQKELEISSKITDLLGYNAPKIKGLERFD
jgi:hypothetical protein